jgi:hypothetical protein
MHAYLPDLLQPTAVAQPTIIKAVAARLLYHYSMRININFGIYPPLVPYFLDFNISNAKALSSRGTREGTEPGRRPRPGTSSA